MRLCSLLNMVLTLAFLAACSNILDDAQYAPDIKLGAKEKTVECWETYGTCSFDVVSNCEYTARIVKGEEWICFKDDKEAFELVLKGSRTLELAYTANRGYRRSGCVVLVAGERRDTLFVRQHGAFDPFILSDEESITVPGEGAEYSVGITTNLLKKDFHFETVDTNNYPVKGRADKYRYTDGEFTFCILPSESRDEKTFIVRLYALDDWGEKVSADITITQKAGRK